MEDIRQIVIDIVQTIKIIVETIVSDKIQNFNLKSSIDRLRRHKKKTRDNFTNLANEIADSNNNQLKYIQADVSNILEQYKIGLDRIVNDLLEYGNIINQIIQIII